MVIELRELFKLRSLLFTFTFLLTLAGNVLPFPSLNPFRASILSIRSCEDRTLKGDRSAPGSDIRAQPHIVQNPFQSSLSSKINDLRVFVSRIDGISFPTKRSQIPSPALCCETCNCPGTLDSSWPALRGVKLARGTHYCTQPPEKEIGGPTKTSLSSEAGMEGDQVDLRAGCRKQASR